VLYLVDPNIYGRYILLCVLYSIHLSLNIIGKFNSECDYESVGVQY